MLTNSFERGTISNNQEREGFVMKKLVEEITNRIKLHHELYSIPVADLMWEEILFKSLKKVGDNGATWDAGSHAIGADVTNSKYGDISCKTGAKTYVKKLDSTFIKINGSRTTKHKTIEEKKKFFAIKKEDVYFCLARNKKEWEFGQKKYYLSIFKTLNHAKLEWKETFGKNGKSTGWSASSDEMKCKISKSMSDQLWTEVKEDYIDAEYPITIR